MSQCEWCFEEGMDLVVVRGITSIDTEWRCKVCEKCKSAFNIGRSSGIYETIRRSRTEVLE